jgi:hypothetical protein
MQYAFLNLYSCRNEEKDQKQKGNISQGTGADFGS